MPYVQKNATKYYNHPNARQPLPKAKGTLEGMGRVEPGHQESKEPRSEERHETPAQEKAEME